LVDELPAAEDEEAKTWNGVVELWRGIMYLLHPATGVEVNS